MFFGHVTPLGKDKLRRMGCGGLGSSALERDARSPDSRMWGNGHRTPQRPSRSIATSSVDHTVRNLVEHPKDPTFGYTIMHQLLARTSILDDSLLIRIHPCLNGDLKDVSEIDATVVYVGPHILAWDI